MDESESSSNQPLGGKKLNAASLKRLLNLRHITPNEHDDTATARPAKQPRIKTELACQVAEKVELQIKILKLTTWIVDLLEQNLPSAINDDVLKTWSLYMGAYSFKRNTEGLRALFGQESKPIVDATDICHALLSPPQWTGEKNEFEEVIHYLIELPSHPNRKSVLTEYLALFFPQISGSKLTAVLGKICTEPAKKVIEFIYGCGDVLRIHNESIEVSRRAFGTGYELGERSLNHFKKYVVKTLSDYERTPENYHSLYFSIVQSSCTGKTRLVLESGRKTMNVLYGCLRPEKSSGYPACNANLKAFFSGKGDKESLEDFLVLAYMTFHSMWKDNQNSDVPEEFPLAGFEGEDVKFHSVWESIIEVFFNASTKDKKDWRKAFDHHNQQPDSPVLLLVIDEARALLDPAIGQEKSIFRNLRAALRAIESKKLVLVFIDTLSAICHFQPSKNLDPSARPELDFDLFPPFYEMLTMNCKPAVFNSDMTREEELMAAFSYGRPVWYAYYFQENNGHDFSGTIQKALKFAKLKLSYSIKPEKDLEAEAAVAVSCVRFGISGVMDHSMATDLMSSYMGIGVYIGEDRLRMKVDYIAEPIIAEAACQLLHGKHGKDGLGEYHFSEDRLYNVLQMFTSKCLSGLVDAGDSGEITARVILSLAYDHVHLKIGEKSTDRPSINPKHLFSDPIKVKDFLNALFSGAYSENYQKYFGCPPVNYDAIPCLDGNIRFTSWKKLSAMNRKYIPEELLKECYHMRCAIILPLNYGGFDLIIPVQMDGDRYTFIAIQVKNVWETFQTFFNAAGEKLVPSEHFDCDETIIENTFSIYMDVNPKTLGDSINGSKKLSDLFSQFEDTSDIISEAISGINELSLGAYHDIGPKRHSKRLEKIRQSGDAPRYKFEKVKKTITEMAEDFKKKMQAFHQSFPRHCVLFGLESSFIKGKLLDMLQEFRKKKVDPIDEENRHDVLSRMDYITYCFSGPGCECKSGCKKNCGCAIKKILCTGACNCVTLPQNLCQNGKVLFHH